ncbi:MAG: coproporphyrinogen III oxidase family protein [Anaerolineaceae bacterium]|nr:coproporphyrinogen III oxidase family protein [Anaerolineaceae bacterium]
MISERLLTTFLRKKISQYLKLNPASSNDLPGPNPEKKYLLYAHIPFCERLCPYCSFNRFIFNEEKTRAYYKDLRIELQMVADMGYDFSSIYIGGGTPTVLIDELCKTIDLANELFSIQDVSCETNPNHLIPELMEQLQGRVHRLSVGMQSFDNGLLKQMNRFEKYGSGEENLKRFQKIADLFPTLNIDMIFNFPSQTEIILREDIKKVFESGVNQTTFYPLMTSPFVAHSMAHSVGKVDYTREVFFYQILNEELEHDFNPVSAWCFSRSGKKMIDEYIVDHEEYLGVGSGSFSNLDGTLFVNTFSLRDYAKRIEAKQMSVSKMRRFSQNEQMRYRFMMELFGLKLDKKGFKERFGKSIEKGLPMEIAFMTLSGAFERRNLLPGERRVLLRRSKDELSTLAP